MEEFETRSGRQRRRRFRFGRLILLLLLVVLIVFGIGAFQYWNAYQAADSEEKEPISFSGDPVTGEVENVLVLGVDSRGEEKSRSDTMMLVSWNKNTDELNVVSFMRDIYADIPGYQSYKLNTAYYLGGVDLLKETLIEMFGVEIHHYALIDFKSFEQLVDIAAPGGVEIDVKKEMSEKIGVTLSPGVQQLNGQELLGYARFRADSEGDFGRVARQQEVMAALKDELLSPSAMLRYPKLAGAAQGYIQTDLSAGDQLMKVMSLALSGGAELNRLTIPVEDSYSYGSYEHAGSVIEIDLEQNREALEQFLGGN